MRLILCLAVLCSQAFGVFQVGDLIPNQCWKTSEETQFCLRDAQGSVRVLLFNAGWCGPCNSEFEELVPRVSEFQGKPVSFISLSASGWSQSQSPDTKFLTEWKDKHEVPFVVAGSPKDAGKQFFEPPLYIPSVVILDAMGNLTYKQVNPGVDKMFKEVNRLLDLMGGGK